MLLFVHCFGADTGDLFVSWADDCFGIGVLACDAGGFSRSGAFDDKLQNIAFFGDMLVCDDGRVYRNGNVSSVFDL